MTFLMALLIVCITAILSVFIQPSCAAMGTPVYMNAPPVIPPQPTVPRTAPVVKPNAGRTDDPLLKRMLTPRLHKKFQVKSDRESLA